MKIFIAYTVRNNENSLDDLMLIKKFISNYGETFLDLIDNDSNQSQIRIETEVKESDLLVLIETPSVYSSSWVKKELDLALNSKTRIIKIPKIMILNLIKINSSK